jgi:hypothetical protein
MSVFKAENQVGTWVFISSQKNYALTMPEIICINCFAHVFVNGDSLICLACEESAEAKPTNAKPTNAKPDQPTYLQMQTLIDEIREIKKQINGLRWFMYSMFIALIILLVAVGVKVNLSPTLITSFTG